MQYVDQAADTLQLEALLSKPTIHNLLETHAKLQPRQAARILVGVLAFIAVLLLIRFGEILAIVSVGVLYPAYSSILLRQRSDNAGPEKDKWLAYWVCFALFSTLIRSPMRGLLKGFPFVFVIECALYVWLYHPKTEGAQLIHKKKDSMFLLQKHGKKIEENINKLNSYTKKE